MQRPALTRRQFHAGLIASAVAAFATRLGAAAETTAVPTSQRRPGLRLLILGGTHLVGPAVVRAALVRGHEVTLFNRGRTRPELFPGVEKLRGDRFPERDAGLAALRSDRTWDVIIDLNAYYPRLVAATAQLLASRASHYLVMSSISVYADFKTISLDESSPVRPLAASFEERADLTEGDWGTYGGRKAACEREAAVHFEGRYSAIRASGIIGGEYDDSTFYWPARIARGGEILAPGTGDDPYQAVDVRDVAALILRICEDRHYGVFNATGPATAVTFRDYLTACMEATGTRPTIRWLPYREMQRLRVKSDETPQWAPAERVPGFARISSTKARALGWATRSLTDSATSSYLYFREKYAADHVFPHVGFTPKREAELMAAAIHHKT